MATYEKNVKEEVRVIQGIKNITNLWKYTSPDVQSKKFLEILDYFMNTTYKDEFNKEQVQGRNLRAFLEYTPKEIIEENYEAICKRALSFEDNSNELSRILIYALPPVQELDDETIRKINEGKLVAKINKKKLDQLDGTIDKGVPICLEIKDVSELTVEQIEQLRNEGINIQYVGMEKQRLNTEQYIPYNIERYRKIRTKIDELLCNVNKNENKLEICLKILQNISKYVSYDQSAVSEFRNEKFFSSRNLEGALLEGMCVCSGYAELVRNMMACRGIEALFIGSKTHAWNQVKLNGQWYNIDITWDRAKLKELSIKEMPKWLFKSNRDFQKHKSHIPRDFFRSRECNESMQQEELEEAMLTCNKRGIDGRKIDQSVLGNELYFRTKTSDLTAAMGTFFNIREEESKDGQDK